MELVKVEKKETEITLKLTQREFNTLVVALGITSSFDRVKAAQTHGLEVLDSASHNFYSVISKVAENLNK